MAGITYGLNPDAMKTALDGVFYQKFNAVPGPQIADASNQAVFIQEKSDRAAEIMEMFKGSNLWTSTPEQQIYDEVEPRIANQITFVHTKYTKSFAISEEAVADDQWALVKRSISDMGDKGRITQTKNAMGIYRGRSGATVCADGVVLLSASHTALDGSTIDNTVSGALAVSTLEAAINSLIEQKDQAGDIRGHEAKTLLVPPALFKEATEITESELLANTTDNNMNWISAKYGIRVFQSPYLGSANASGSQTYWFLLSDNHSIMRFVREPIFTELIGPEYSPKRDSVYRGKFRESYGAISYEGLVGYAT